MNILRLLTAALLTWCRVAAKPPPTDELNVDLQLLPDELLLSRPGTGSYTYDFPNPMLRVKDGTTVSVFGVKTTSDFTLQLYSIEATPKPEPFTITKTDKGWKVQYTSASREYEDAFNMPKDKFVWFIIERTNDYLALYRAGEAKPILTASNKVLKTRLNFNTLQRFRVSSKEDALWDFLGYFFKLKDMGNIPKKPFLDTVVQKVKKGYADATNHLARCAFVIPRWKTAKQENNERFFLANFFVTYCQNEMVLLKLQELRQRYGVMLLTSGEKLPEKPSDDKCKKYICDKRSFKI